MAPAAKSTLSVLSYCCPVLRGHHGVVDSVGGYRLVRKLGEGERAEVFLGHAGADAAPRPDRTAAIKLYRASTPLASIDTEIEALARVSARHVLELRDLAIAADGRPCLIVPRLGSASLGRLLAGRTVIEAGEAVTALVPVVEAVGELHRVGVAHGAVRLSSILLDHVGAPVLAGFGRADLIGALPNPPDGRSLSPAQFAEEPRVARDLDDLVALVRGVLARIRQTAGRPAHSGLLGWLDDTDRFELADRFTGELAERIFGLAPALPLRLDDPVRGEAQRDEWRGPPAAVPLSLREADGEVVDRRPLRAVGATKAARRGAHQLQTRQRSVDPGRPAAALARLGDRARTSLASVRRPVWIGGAAGLVSLVAAVAIFAPSSAGSRSAPTPSRASARSAPALTGTASTAVTADDPVAASLALVAARAECIERLSVVCLDGVDQAGSAAIEADENLIRTLQQGDRPPAALRADRAELVQRLGDSAMVRLVASGTSGPASLLLVRGGAGWRIRDIAPG
jgi:hypothetical protein